MKNNKYWFVPKQYGYGVTPCSWEGWLVTLGLVVLVLGLGYFNGLFEESETFKERDLVLYLLEVAGLVYAFMRLTKPRTKGDLQWRWGEKS